MEIMGMNMATATRAVTTAVSTSCSKQRKAEPGSTAPERFLFSLPPLPVDAAGYF
jgi:hypothetical protein